MARLLNTTKTSATRPSTLRVFSFALEVLALLTFGL